MKYKLSKDVKRNMERELRQYYTNKKELEDLKKGIDGSNTICTRRFLYLERRIIYVENVFNKLDSSEQEIYNYIFKLGYNWLYCQMNKNITKDTYYNVFNKATYLLAQEWGEI